MIVKKGNNEKKTGKKRVYIVSTRRDLIGTDKPMLDGKQLLEKDS